LEKVNYFGGGKSRWEEEKRKGWHGEWTYTLFMVWKIAQWSLLKSVKSRVGE
jgi:hypothetical protein